MTEIKLHKKFQPLFKPKRIKVFFGGRGGGKTVAMCKALVFLAAQDKRRVLCLREFQNSNVDICRAPAR